MRRAQRILPLAWLWLAGCPEPPKPQTCFGAWGFDYEQGGMAFQPSDSAGHTDTPPALDLVTDVLDDTFTDGAAELHTEGSLEAGFTLVAGQRVPAQGESCYESYDVELTYSLVLPADWDSALGERYAPMEFTEAVTVSDHDPRPHILWDGWEVIMMPAVDFAMP